MNLPAIARMHNAARDKRQLIQRFFKSAKPTCIDYDSPAGSWQAVLDSGAHSIRVVSDYDLDARLALRKAARQEPDPHKRGWLTRAINAGAV